jgi:hypothetical protein
MSAVRKSTRWVFQQIRQGKNEPDQGQIAPLVDAAANLNPKRARIIRRKEIEFVMPEC